jgi:HrpA-like RNA helicase
LVQELYGNRERERDDQILCFVNSSSDVHQCCELLAYVSNGAIVAYPLVQSQTSKVQQDMLRKGSVFFSTTVAETSLTFPSLRYVVDTGIVNIPVYDMETKTTVIKEVRASQSTIKQRLGRLGRTKPGDYYALYDDKVGDPEPQICRSELTDIDFSLRKTALKVGLNGMKQFLPDVPKQTAIDFGLDQQRKLRKFYHIIPLSIVCFVLSFK